MTTINLFWIPTSHKPTSNQKFSSLNYFYFMPALTYPMLLDGGLSNVLESQGCNLDHPLWTAEILLSDPEKVIAAHSEYLKAGSQILITSSYQATIPGLTAGGLSDKEAENVLIKSIELAREAVKRFTRDNPQKPKALVAASIGPYGAYLADGSEYHGDYNIDRKKLRYFHERKIRLLDDSDADLLACETIPSLEETFVLAELLAQCRKESWVSFSCKDDHHLNDGSPITAAVEKLSSVEQVFAIGVNCTRPEYISGLISSMNSINHKKKVIIYPNTGEVYDATTKSWSGEKGIPSTHVKEWINLGADIIGGCCRIGPDEIKDIAKYI